MRSSSMPPTRIAPQASLAPNSRCGVVTVSQSFQVLPLCSISQFRLARALMVRGSITASMTARLYSRDIQPWANSLGSIWVKVRPIHASCTATKARQIRAIFLRRHLKNSIRSSFIGSLPFPL